MKNSKPMPRHNFKKNSGSIRAGFLYQDLVAIEILINFYRNRNLYKWVQLEAEDSEFKSVEDVVACKPNGLYELTQVKFTVDPDAPANRLSWKWLTEVKKKNGTSLLQKWAPTTLRHWKAGTLAWAGLKTDRVPDAAFSRCLRNGKVVTSMIPTEITTKIEEQIGSREKVESFFESFEFVHSLKRLDDLEDKLRQRLASETDEGGWYKFWIRVQRWSTQKYQPDPDGKIRYIHLRQVFSVDRSRPIPQDFRVPASYIVPDRNFDRAFLDRITGSDGLIVLWGPPGSGKSTYLSHFVAHVNRESAVCIRHHYFLSLADRSEGRYHFHAIDQSLRHQIEEVMPDLDTSRKNLGALLETVARELKRDNRRLVIIIDGLDHVWRNHRDHEEMEALFDALLPLPPNVRLVVGTQKITSKHLPAKLLNAIPFEQWTELPLMSQAAVHSWLRFQDRAGRLHLEMLGRERRGRVFGKVARAFCDISRGLPLHLIYSFEEIVQTGKAITAEDVTSLPACPTGDIRDYYRSFWDRTDEKAHTILHVLAGLEFGPPPFALHDCFGHSDESFATFAAIDHLLDRQETEVRPFHESLFAFVRDLPGHKNIFLTHAREVLNWLETRAPKYWHWAWLWITKAQLGDASDLLACPNREWAISSLVAGYPIDQISAILDRAERVAFDALELPRLLSLRSLKERTIYGPVFQTNEWPLFREVGILLSSDPSVGAILRAELHKAPAGLIPFIVGNSEEPLRERLAQGAIDELYRRATRYDIEKDGYNDQSELAHTIVAVTANTKAENFTRVITLATKNAHATDTLMATYSRASLLASNYDNVFTAGKRCTCPELDRDVLAALCLEGLAPASIPKLKAFTHPAIRCLALLKGGGVARRSRTPKDFSRLFVGSDRPDTMFAVAMSGVLYEAFFAALAAGLAGGKAQGWSKIPPETQSTWLGKAVRALERLAGGIVDQWQSSSQWPTLGKIYDAFEIDPPSSPSTRENNSLIAVRLALRDIAIDLCIIAIGLDANALIEASDISAASKSPFWLDELWLEAFSERHLPLHTPEAARVIVQRVGSQFDTEITEFNERTTVAVKLAMFAAAHGLIPLAKKELRRAVGCLLGYGWRKDLFAFEVLKSLELLAETDDVQAKNAILHLAGEFEAITTYTDGDETNHARENYYQAIAAYFPKRAPACYAHLIHNEEWRYAEALAIAIAKSDLVESRIGLALLESYIDPSEVLALEDIESESRPYTKMALAAVHRKIGKVAETTLKNEDAENIGYQHTMGIDPDSERAEVSLPHPREFPPGRLQEYLSVTRDAGTYSDRRELVTSWLRYWEANGSAERALIDLETTVSETAPYRDLDAAFDVAFKIALEIQGRSKAFPWLIHAHIARFGWQWYHSDEEAQARMKAVAQHFPFQWKEFIKDTAKPVFPVDAARNGIYIGRSRLVFFLMEVGELELARNYALEMARIFKAELKEQPIDTPEWAK